MQLGSGFMIHDAIPEGPPSPATDARNLADNDEEMAAPHSMEKRSASGGDAPEPKRAKPIPPDPDDHWALVSCFDDRDHFVEVDTRILEPFNCRLFMVIKHETPKHCIHTGRPYWRSSMTRSMLTTFVRSLEHGELSLGKNVGVSEAVTTMEYENIPMGVSSKHMVDKKLLAEAPTGPVFQKRAERVHMVVVRTAEQVAHAICRWPRLEASLDAALTGFPVAATCTATRAWVRFCKKPQVILDKGDRELALARKWPNWIQATLMTFGIMHDRLVASGTIATGSRDKESYEALETKAEADMLGSFMFAPFDWPRHAMQRATRKEQALGEKFANEMRDVLLDSNTRPEGGPSAAVAQRVEENSEKLTYARACFSMAETLVQDAPSPATMFGGQCADDQGKSPERSQLEKSLKQRGIKVVRWSEDEKNPSRPLVFPPHWADGPSSGSVHCAVLLDFSDRR